MVAATVLNMQLRFQGSAVFSMVGMVTGAILNIFLDPLFIFVFDMGIKGAAAATMVSQMVSFFILFVYGGSRKGNIRIRFRHFSLSLALYIEMFRGGIPALLRQGLTSVATIIINRFAGNYGDAAIAAISIVNRLYMFASSVMLGFGQGFQPVCGFNYGAKLYRRLKKAFWFCVRLSSAGLTVMAVVLAIFAPQVIAFFRKADPEVIRIGAMGLRLHCVTLPLNAWIVMCNMMTQTIGRPLEASLISMCRRGLFLIPYLVILTPLYGLMGIQLSLPASDLTAFIFVIPLARRVLNGMKETGTCNPTHYGLTY
jgi:putative MATE family efflux protein